MNVKGKVVKIMDAETYGNFSKREFVIETIEKYPQKILLQVINDRIDLVNNLNENDLIDCAINLRGKEWTSPKGETKYFNSLVCWSLTLLDQNSEQNEFNSKEYAKKEANKMFENDIERSYETDDDLPF